MIGLVGGEMFVGHFISNLNKQTNKKDSSRWVMFEVKMVTGGERRNKSTQLRQADAGAD